MITLSESLVRQTVAVAFLLITSLVLIRYLSQKRNLKSNSLRYISSLNHLRWSILRSVEIGKRVHIGLGSAPLVSNRSASALSGLAAVEKIAQVCATGDFPPLATSGDGPTTILAQNRLIKIFNKRNISERYRVEFNRYSASSPWSYAVATAADIQDENVSCNILCGNMGSEAGLPLASAEMIDAPTFGGSDSLAGQAVCMAGAKEPLVGEEVYAIPGYINLDPVFFASLKTQDVIRMLVILVLLLGAILEFLGITVI